MFNFIFPNNKLNLFGPTSDFQRYSLTGKLLHKLFNHHKTNSQERLRLQRNREYNQFKLDKENQTEMLRASKGLSPRRLTTWATPIYLPNEPNNNNIPPKAVRISVRTSKMLS